MEGQDLVSTTANLSTLTGNYPEDGLCRILALDGGGAKGFYALGVLKEIGGMHKYERTSWREISRARGA